MVKRCVICGNVDGDNNVSVHRFPTDERRLQWVEFVVNQGFPVNLTSTLCSRHFVPGLDYRQEHARRRSLFHTAVPSLVVRPYREREDHVENVDAGVQVPRDELLLEDNIEVVEVMMDNDNVEVVEVMMDNDNVEADEVAMDDDNVEIVIVNADEQVSDNDNFVGVFDLSPLYDIQEVEKIAPVVARLLLDRPAGIQHPLPEPHYIGALNYVCRYCRARHFKCEETSPNNFSTCCNNGLMAVSGPRVLTPAPYLLQRLLVEDSVEGRHYRNNIRRYNNTLAFAAFSTAFNTRRLPGRGPNVFTVHGQGYWTISNDLIGNEPIQRRFCQLYFVESGEANRIRREQQQLLPAAQRLLPNVLEDLDGLLRGINPFAQAFE
ncbi:unnamed protein product [Macrosiphum euphorbiae]|uniref:THAP-type domain-containing protein n=2 Tax=Macrosiphum euphorbiae TaxID=13131 RepID=A0AAV0WM07_9HEMI|nr:unnamed protein product [Macrosiphum euphorbiae]